jgi:hypothetical protein
MRWEDPQFGHASESGGLEATVAGSAAAGADTRRAGLEVDVRERAVDVEVGVMVLYAG